MNDKDNPYGLPPVPPANPYANPYASPGPPAPPQPPSPFANPFGPGAQAQHGPPPIDHGFNPYAPPSAHAQGPAWAQNFGLTQELASPGSRLIAQLLDGLLYFGVAMALGMPGVALASEDAAGGLAVLGWIGLAIYQWYLISTTGQSLGKKWMNVRIVKLDGSPVDFVSGVLLRIWAFWGLTFVGGLIVIGSILPLVDALMIFGDDRRCLHDHLASTKVVVG